MTTGLVPTMGALHAGHRALLRQARAECDEVVMSLFVNPTQFGPGEDLDRYPRDEDRDRAIAAEEGADRIFAPTVEEMYPDGFSTAVSVGDLGARFEGAHRPGHFDGVATVVLKLFNLLRPDAAYFGQKDAQQLAVIRRMTADLDLGSRSAPSRRCASPTASRCRHETPTSRAEERRRAPSLHRALAARDPGLVEGEVDYLAVVDADTFLEVEPAAGRARDRRRPVRVDAPHR